jgi:hypothetical protein
MLQRWPASGRTTSLEPEIAACRGLGDSQGGSHIPVAVHQQRRDPLAELLDKGWIYRVLERGENVGEPRPRPAQAARGPEQRQAKRAARIVDGEPLSHVTTARCTDEHGRVEPDRIHECADIVGEVMQPVVIRRLRGVAMPALVERERVDPLRQRGHQLTEAALRIQPGVEQHNRNAVRISLLDVRQLKSVPKQRAMHQELILAAAAGIAPESIPVAIAMREQRSRRSCPSRSRRASP